MTNTDPHAMRSCDRISRYRPRSVAGSPSPHPFCSTRIPKDSLSAEMRRNFSQRRTCKTARPFPYEGIPHSRKRLNDSGPPFLLYGICNVNGRL
ncbi:hypothetical protein TNCV_3831951 [Trichonephila clavipes]|nr:hypothetical protein TNCV_3831951 [Trichonephila clavipes]